jgi:hypothetical protein
MKSKTWSFRGCLCILMICFSSTGLFSQGFPPAQGPPLPPDPPLQFAASVLINFVKTTVQTSLDTINAQIARDADATGIQAHLSFSLKTFAPGMSTTTYPNRPNQNVVRIPFIVIYDVTGIRYHGIPYLSRTLGQSIELLVACNNWYTDQGALAIMARADRPYLGGNSFAEEALNFFIAHTLSDLVDSKLRARLPNGSNSITPITTSPCNCLGVTAGTAPNFTDGAVNFKKVNRLMPVETAVGASVSVKSIKRLSARVNAAPYYKEVEDFQLELYVNQTLQVAQVTGMREGDVRDLSLPAVTIPQPGPNSMIVLIANIAQQPLLSPTDTRFNVFKKNVNFGNGTQQLIITKTFWEPPHRLPDGRMTKPTQRQIDAYQITVNIKAGNPVIMH